VPNETVPTGTVPTGTVPAEKMPAAVYVGDGRIEVQQVAVPLPGPGEVLVEVASCGICGTDLHLVLERYARPGDILGHEWAGTVATDGSGSGFEVGTAVVSDTVRGCGKCRACASGRPAVCLNRPPPDFSSWDGAFCRYRKVPANRLLRVPDGLSARQAALTEPTAIAIHCVSLSGATPDDRVLVTGAGPVGALTVAVLVASGIEDITVSEPSEIRREHALAVGAASVIYPEELPSAPTGRPVKDPFSIIFECSGNATAAETALDQLDYAGTFLFVGTGHAMPRVNHNRIIVMEQILLGAFNYDAEGFGPALDLLASGRLPLDILIEKQDVTLDGVLDAIERLSRGEIAGKVLVRPEVRQLDAEARSDAHGDAHGDAPSDVHPEVLPEVSA
jgi:(R,R)-butanediol dehydrogenase/meso-butanediol dehydrogenase/diacetyl reductase